MIVWILTALSSFDMTFSFSRIKHATSLFEITLRTLKITFALKMSKTTFGEKLKNVIFLKS